MFVCVRGRVQAMLCMWKEDLWESVLSLHHVVQGPNAGGHTQWKCLYP